MPKEFSISLHKLHKAQTQVIKEKQRFNVLCCGRRWGKSKLAINLIIESCLQGNTVGYFAPSYKLLSGTFKEVYQTLEPITKRKNENQFIETITGGGVEFWSLENELAGRSRKYKMVILDEAAFSRNLWKCWTESIRATLTDLKGDAYFLSTPKGKNDFYKLYQKGLHDDKWASWQMSTYTNPYIDKEEIDDARHDLPELAFSQEYLAEFNDNIANPFGTDFIAACVRPQTTNLPVCFGIDLAKSYDYTVIIGLDSDCNVCHFERFQKDWRATTEHIKGLAYGVPIAIDSTGVGDPIAEDVARGRNVDMVKFTSQSKQQMMEGLAMKIQKCEIGFPEGIIKDELDNFEYLYTRTGVKYSAPVGMHDDCVCALALAVSKFKKNSHYGKYNIS